MGEQRKVGGVAKETFYLDIDNIFRVLGLSARALASTRAVAVAKERAHKARGLQSVCNTAEMRPSVSSDPVDENRKSSFINSVLCFIKTFSFRIHTGVFKQALSWGTSAFSA